MAKQPFRFRPRNSKIAALAQTRDKLKRSQTTEQELRREIQRITNQLQETADKLAEAFARETAALKAKADTRENLELSLRSEDSVASLLHSTETELYQIAGRFAGENRTHDSFAWHHAASRLHQYREILSRSYRAAREKQDAIDRPQAPISFAGTPNLNERPRS
jgi:DNA repair exonuclease SbcCD ATPase subunit